MLSDDIRKTGNVSQKRLSFLWLFAFYSAWPVVNACTFTGCARDNNSAHGAHSINWHSAAAATVRIRVYNKEGGRASYSSIVPGIAVVRVKAGSMIFTMCGISIEGTPGAYMCTTTALYYQCTVLASPVSLQLVNSAQTRMSGEVG